MTYWLVYFGLVVFTVSLAANYFLLFRFVWQDENSKLRPVVQNISMSILSIMVTLLLLELFFFFFAQSDGANYTLASQNWFARYWRLNSIGYRDKEWTPEMFEGRTKIMALGDSFVAGHGIKKPADRFSDLLGQMLGDGYAVMNVGRPGAETKEEFKMALEYPYPPDITILTFYINDIIDTATSIGIPQPNFIPNSPTYVELSYAANFAYWRLVRLGPQEVSNNYWGWVSGLYQDTDVWQTYSKLLLEINDFSRQRDIKLIVVVFPNLRAIEESQPVTSKVIALYEKEGRPVVDVSRLVKGMNPQDLWVNQVDSHANEFVHHLVAKELYKIITNNEKISGDRPSQQSK